MKRFSEIAFLMSTDAADLSTDEIVAKVLEGDVDSYQQIVVRYQGDVMKIVNAMLIDYSAREEVVQMVFVRTFQKLEQYETGRGFAKWIKAITRNLVREELRKRYRYKNRIRTYAERMIDQMDEESHFADAEAEQRERQETLHECIDLLEEKAGRAVRLHYVEQHSTEQVAEALGRTGGAIRTLLYRARAQLKTCLESKGVMAS